MCDYCYYFSFIAFSTSFDTLQVFFCCAHFISLIIFMRCYTNFHELLYKINESVFEFRKKEKPSRLDHIFQLQRIKRIAWKQYTEIDAVVQTIDDKSHVYFIWFKVMTTVFYGFAKIHLFAYHKNEFKHLCLQYPVCKERRLAMNSFREISFSHSNQPQTFQFIGLTQQSMNFQPGFHVHILIAHIFLFIRLRPFYFIF